MEVSSNSSASSPLEEAGDCLEFLSDGDLERRKRNLGDFGHVERNFRDRRTDRHYMHNLIWINCFHPFI